MKSHYHQVRRGDVCSGLYFKRAILPIGRSLCHPINEITSCFMYSTIQEKAKPALPLKTVNLVHRFVPVQLQFSW